MSKNYQVLARKYRPHMFEEMVGQSHTIKTLVNALNSNNLHHGFIFTGTRGVGKTTIARIFAKSINCEKGVSANPCSKCETCIEIDKGQSVDLIELDAASHTGVDHMREILENAQYMPTKDRFKVYLIDEVHMLSKSSFNALLKTLEEPPSHIKFLLATTDPQKLPITVLSRCLQFNLNKLTQDEILAQLKFIMDSENLKFEESALFKIAAFGNGSMRDALSLLDQSISFGNGSVMEKDIKAMLGLVHQDDIVKLAGLIIERNADKVISFVNELAHRGENLSNVLKDLTSLIHQISIAQMLPQNIQSSVEITTLAEKISLQDLQLFYQIAINSQKDLGYAPSEQIGLEMTLLRMIAFHSEFNLEKKTLKKDANHKDNKISISATKSKKHKPTKKEKILKKEGNTIKNSDNISRLNGNRLNNQKDWERVIQTLPFSGAAKTLVKNTLFASLKDKELTLTLDKQYNNLLTSRTQKSIEKILFEHFDIMTLLIEIEQIEDQTLSQKETLKMRQLKEKTEQQFLNDKGVKVLQEAFNVKADIKSIKPL
jgi:DNA polymerase-3 subunit gamma/tau